VLHLISLAQTSCETLPEMLGNQSNYRQRHLQFCRRHVNRQNKNQFPDSLTSLSGLTSRLLLRSQHINTKIPSSNALFPITLQSARTSRDIRNQAKDPCGRLAFTCFPEDMRLLYIALANWENTEVRRN
jgi:hypothetical protein